MSFVAANRKPTNPTPTQQLLVGQRPTPPAKPVTPTNNTTTNNHSRMTVAGMTVTVSPEESERLARQDAARLHEQRKLSLVLDLDHTLVHATADPRARKFREQREDVQTLVLPVVMLPRRPIPKSSSSSRVGQTSRNNQSIRRSRIWYQHHFVKLRPHVKEFFDSVQDLFEIGVYTAGTREYAEQICLLLARHLVGAPCDPVELDLLRHRVAHLQHKQKQKEHLKQEDDDKNNVIMEEAAATNGDQPQAEDTRSNESHR